MTKEDMAQALDGKTMFGEGTMMLAVQNHLVVIVVTYDNLISVIGDIEDDIPPVDMDLAILLKGEKFTDDEDSKYRYMVDRNMILPLSDEYNNDDHPRLIRLDKEPEGTNLTWRVMSNISHAKFTLYEDGEPYSEGIVIDLDEVKQVKQQNMNLKFIPITPVSSDCSQAFRVELNGEYTVGELIDHVINTYKNEWGYFKVGYCYIEYRCGKIVRGYENIQFVKDLKIVHVIASGGYTQMNYIVKIKYKLVYA